MTLRENTLFDGRYRLVKSLGQGASAQVWLAKDTMAGDLKVALKILSAITNIDTYGIQNFESEFTFVYNIQHQNLLTPTNYAICEGTPYLVLPYCDNGSLTSMIGRADESDVIKMLHDVAAGLECLHDHDIVHQDIKPDNILLDDNCNFLVTDFGISTLSAGKKAAGYGNYGGTPEYMGPERYEKDATPVKMNDIWALGATAYEMVMGNPPFGDHGGMLQQMGESMPDLPGTLQPELRRLILSCLEPEPWNRPSAADIRKKTQLYMETGGWKTKDGKHYLMLGGIAAAALLLLLGIFVWDYNRTKVFYYKDYSEFWGVPKGIGRLSGSEMKHRRSTYRFEMSQRKVRRVCLVNSRGKVVDHNDTENLTTRFADTYYYYTDNGKLDYKTTFDPNGKMLYKMDYDENLKTVTFRQNDEYGTEKNLQAQTTNTHSNPNELRSERSPITRYLLDYEKDGLLRKLVYAGLQNMPVCDADNIHGIVYKYDKKGRKTEEQYIGLDETPTTNKDGLSIKEFAYDDDDNWIYTKYLNVDRKASHDGTNVTVVALEYDEYGNRIKEIYTTFDGKPAIRTDANVAGFSYTLDDNGCIVTQTSLGIDGKPSVNIYGICVVKDSSNADGFVVKRTFFDDNNNPVLFTDNGLSYGRLDVEMNEHGQPTSLKYFDEFGNAIEINDGYHRVVNEYDSVGNNVCAKYFDKTGKPALLGGFQHESRYEYDVMGNLTRVSFYDSKGNLTLNEEGEAGFMVEYNRQGGVTRTTTFGQNGKPVVNADMTAGFVYEYDEKGNRKSMKYFDTEGKTCMSADGFAEVRYEYDEKTNQCIAEKQYNASGKLLSDNRYEFDNRGNVTKQYALNEAGGLSQGTAVACRKYDNNNHITEISYHDLKGNAVNKPGENYSVNRAKYDEQGNPIEETYWGTSGKPAHDNLKTHKRIHRFDGMNRVVYEKNLGVDDKPISGAAVNPEGKVVYDRFGNVSDLYCYDGYGKPRIGSDGFHHQRTEYNKRNKLVLIEYLDTEGKLVMSKSNEYAKAAYEYDERGNLVHERYYNAKGKCFRHDTTTYNNKNRRTGGAILDGNDKPTDSFTNFAKFTIDYDSTGVVYKTKNYYKASGQLLATQQFDAKKGEWMGAEMVHYWRDDVQTLNRQCPMAVEDGLVMSSVMASGNMVVATFKMTSISASSIDANVRKQLIQYIVSNYGSVVRSYLRLPKNVGLSIRVIDNRGNVVK